MGKFQIDHAFIDDFDLMRDIMRDIIIIRAESMYDINAIVYTGLSRNFRRVDQGEIIPTYKIIITKDEFSNLISFEELQ